MTAFAAGPAWPADDLTTDKPSSQGEECERKHKALLEQIAERLGVILAGGDSFELTWFLQGLAAISKLAAAKADELVEENRKKH